ncbi:hypothetical protein LUZ60_009725 [Juncus effusus]|nr:hypothetical protein LUZ60_009725 [Juncus effusus]
MGSAITDGGTNFGSANSDGGSAIVLSSEEESWLAQYGQVDKNNNTIPLNETIKAVDLWDWELVKEGQNRKITGRLAGQSSKLHPSSAGFLKTAAIRQTHLDPVRVSSGKLYRLRTPSGKYLATLLAYDSSNPTKDWGFPTLSTDSQLENITIDSIINLDQSNNNEEKQVYRDRAAERRRLHGINGIAPFQKGVNNNNNDDDDNKMDLECDATSAQEEARQLAFGTGSYARKIMQNMGWKDGEALGSSEKGIVEPIHNVGNKGQAGLGFKN